MRRLLEGRRIYNERQSRQSRSVGGGDEFRGERERIKEQASANAIEQYKAEQGLA